MIESDIILSVIMIAHNQAPFVRRCAESIINQPVPFPYEIIMSDDKSNDGTWEILCDYASKYPEPIRNNGLYTPRIVATQIDSSNYNPANKSQRGGWNRSNACSHATGKYMVVIDADDYYKKGAHNFADQVAILEAHPDCSLCMENIYILNKGDDFSKARLLFPQEFYEEGKIITAEEYIMNRYFMNTVAFMYRLNNFSPAQYGSRNVDVTITSHFMQFGKIVCYNSADYVYENYPNSTSHAMEKDDDVFIFWEQGIYISALIPALSHWYLLSRIDDVQKVVSSCRHNYILKPKNKKFLQGMDVYVYDAFNKKRTIIDRFRLHLSTWFIGQMKIHKWTNRLTTKILYKLIIR